MSTESALRRKILDGIAESEVKVGADNFYRTTTLKEVLGWLDELGGDQSIEHLVDDPNRLVCGTGHDGISAYEVVRRVKAKEYRVEYDNGTWRKVTLAEAVQMVDEPNLGTPGLSAFDKAYANAG